MYDKNNVEVFYYKVKKANNWTPLIIQYKQYIDYFQFNNFHYVILNNTLFFDSELITEKEYNQIKKLLVLQ